MASNHPNRSAPAAAAAAATSTTPLLEAVSSRSRSPSPLPRAFSPNLRRSSSSEPLLGEYVRRRRRSPRRYVHPALITVVLVALIALVTWDVSPVGRCYLRPLCRALNRKDPMAEVYWRNAGPYAPWKSLGAGGGPKGLPRGCKLDQVNLLQRHTARFPTSNAGACLQKALDKLANRAVPVPRRHPELAFLAHADLKMRDWRFEHLMDSGRKSAWRAGRRAKDRYRGFLQHAEGTFSRSAGGARVVETGSYWLEGFEGNQFKIQRPERLPQVDLVILEGETANNTLSVHNCLAYEAADPKPGYEEKHNLDPLLEPIAHRLNTLLKPSPPLDVDDLVCLGDMCPYDSHASDEDWTGSESWSKWCGIFTREEWEILGYRRDVERYYEVGQGSTYGATLGAGYVRELVARLTDSVPQAFPTINTTLEDSSNTFPRGGKRFFVDFTHDNEIIEILTSMHLLRQHNDLPTSAMVDKRSYVLSEIIPFGAQIVFERISCDLAGWEPDPNGSNPHDEDGRKDYLRILINDKPHRIDEINCKQSGLMEHHLCEVELVQASQAWALQDVDWGVCDVDGGEVVNAAD